MAAGYIYVLANSSMPGLVKVGKTTRLPSERANELSGVTGVATPFIVVYEEYFDDCDAVEAHVHTALAAKGLRLSDNREFFRAAVSDVVKAIISAGVISVRVTESMATTDTNELAGLLTPNGPELDDFRLDGYRAPEPWDALMAEADKHYYGGNGYLEDHAEAFKLYRDAARLGSPGAYERLGDLYRFGEGTREDKQRALDCYKEGVKRGNYYCYASMATLFTSTNHTENALKALVKFISAGEVDGWKSYLSFPNRHIQTIGSFLMLPKVINGSDARLIAAVHHYLPQVRQHTLDSFENPVLRQTYEKHGMMPAFTALINSIDAWLRAPIGS